jgi:hypothetical protein
MIRRHFDNPNKFETAGLNGTGVGAFERAAELRPTGEFFAGERLPWLHLHDGSSAI